MIRLQDLVDKFQLKIKAYERQAEEAVRDFLFNKNILHLVHLNLISFWCVTGGAGQHSSGEAEGGAERAGGGGGVCGHRRVPDQ